MADTFEQNIPGTSRLLNVSKIIQEIDPRASCESLATHFEENINEVKKQLLNNLYNEWYRAKAVNPNLSTLETARQKKLEKLLDLLNYFVEECLIKKESILSQLPAISAARRNYISTSTNYHTKLLDFTLNETHETKITFLKSKIMKNNAKRTYHELLRQHNHKVLDLQLLLDNLKQGIIIIKNPVSDQQKVESFSKALDDVRSLCVFPGETAEQKLERDTEFNSWKEMLKLPSNWLVKFLTSESEVPGHEGFNPENIDVTSNLDPSEIPSTSGSQEAVPSSSRERELNVTPPSVSSLDVCQILEEEDLHSSCMSLHNNFEKNIHDAMIQIIKKFKNEWNRAVAMNPNLQKIRKNDFLKPLTDLFQLFITRCQSKSAIVTVYLPKINRIRREYISKLTSYYEALREFTLNETDETRMTLTRLEKEKDTLRREHNTLLIDYNQKVLDLQMELDNFKQGIVTITKSGQEENIFFSKGIEEFRNLCVIPGETAEQKLARDREFDSWKEMLRLPSNWLVEIQTPQPQTSGYEDFSLMNIGVTSDVDPLNISPTSTSQEAVPPSSNEREFNNIPSPDLNQINISSPSRSDQINVPPSSVQQPSRESSPTLTIRSSGSSSLGSDEFRPKSSIGDTPLHRKHIENENLIRRIKRTYQKLRRDIQFYITSDPFSREYQEIQQLTTTVQNLSREWRIIQVTERDDSTTRDEESRDRERDATRDEERIRRPHAERTSIQSVQQLYNEWTEAKNNLRTYKESIDSDWDKIAELQRSLATLYLEMERNGESVQLDAAEDTIQRDLVELRRKIGTMQREIITLRNIVRDKKLALTEKLQKLHQNLLQKKARLERKIARSQSVRG